MYPHASMPKKKKNRRKCNYIELSSIQKNFRFNNINIVSENHPQSIQIVLGEYFLQNQNEEED